MNRIFISYSRKDQAFASRLAASLSALTADVWIDFEDIEAGKKWSTAIQQGLNESDVMIVVITPDSMASTNVEDEWQYYLDQKKPVIPVLLRPAQVHFQLSRIQYINFHAQSYEVAFQQLQAELIRRGILSRPPTVTVDVVKIPVQEPLPVRPESLPTRHDMKPSPEPRRGLALPFIVLVGVSILAIGLIGAYITLGPESQTMTATATSTPTNEVQITATSQSANPVSTEVALQPTVVPTNTPPPLPTAFGGSAGTIVFASSRSGVFGLFQVYADGTGETPLATSVSSVWEPAWSPDGTRVAFDAGAEGSRDIWVMNADGSGLQPLTSDPGDDRAPSWSPDGTRIAYQSMRDGNREIYTVYVFNPNDKQRLTYDAAVDALPSWSPDGSLIAFATDRWRGSNNGDIAIMSAFDGSGARPLTGSGNNLSPAWSPDGRSMAFVSADASGNRDLYVYDMATGNLRPLAADSGINEDYPAWSPDSQHIIFSRGAQIVVMNLAGIVEQTLTASGGNNSWPDWRR